MTSAAWCTEARVGADVVLTLRVHVQPGAKRNAIAGVQGDALKIRIASPPVDGRANDELVRFLAELFGVPRRAVTVVHGITARRKVVRVHAPVLRPDLQWARAMPRERD